VLTNAAAVFIVNACNAVIDVVTGSAALDAIPRVAASENAVLIASEKAEFIPTDFAEVYPATTGAVTKADATMLPVIAAPIAADIGTVAIAFNWPVTASTVLMVKDNEGFIDNW
jgi:hypothetical protein